MTSGVLTLIGTAAALGTIHTITGPDHYIPFVAISKTRNWNIAQTAAVTILCGLGHVLSSIILGAIGILIGSAVNHLVSIESHRGEIAAWLLTAFGFVYMIWGIRAAIKHHIHEHSHNMKGETTLWILFIVFVFGPCEPLIPLLMYPAATENTWAIVAVSGVFAICTITTMLAAVLLLRYGIGFVSMAKLHRYSHALAGASIFCCGLLIHFGL